MQSASQRAWRLERDALLLTTGSVVSTHELYLYIIIIIVIINIIMIIHIIFSISSINTRRWLGSLVVS